MVDQVRSTRHIKDWIASRAVNTGVRTPPKLRPSAFRTKIPAPHRITLQVNRFFRYDKSCLLYIGSRRNKQRIVKREYPSPVTNPIVRRATTRNQNIAEHAIGTRSKV